MMTVNEAIGNYRQAQGSGALLPCPRCGLLKMSPTLHHNAMSRRCEAFICSDCGVEEAFENFSKNIITPVEDWFIVRNLYGINTAKQNEDGKYEINVNVKLEIAPQDIDDIVATALEGGINYWCDKAEVIEDEYYGEYASDQISKGGSLRLSIEGEDCVELTLDKLLNGIALAVRNGYAIKFIEDGHLNMDCVDGAFADCVIQFAVFGELVYG